MGFVWSRQVVPYVPCNKPPPTIFDLECHPRADAVCAELDSFFMKHWPFKDQKERNRFFASQTNRWACFAFPMADDDRLLDTVKVNTLLFLLDGKFAHGSQFHEDMSLEEGKKLYKRLIPIAMGKKLPNRKDPYEWITYDIWTSMRACDKELADQVLREALVCITAQVDTVRLACPDMGTLLRQRIKEGGCAFVAACIRYSSQLRIPNETLKSLAKIEESYGKLGIIVNDIHSFDKEFHLWNKSHKEGAKLLNIVNTMSIDAGVSYGTAKRILWILCREWEIDHQEMVAKVLEGKGGSDPALRSYLKGLEYVLGGNEYWSETTERYHWRD
ncbi:aristolochene synthase [Usnea florida]